MPLKSLFSSKQELHKMLLRVHKDVLSYKAGAKFTKKRAQGNDFLGLREYMSGDEIRFIDWIVSAKLSKPYVKIFQEEKELNIILAPLLGASMNFGLQRVKQDYLSEVCAYLSFAAVQQQSSLSSYIGSDTTFQALGKSKKLEDVHVFVEKIASYDSFAKAVNYQDLSKQLYKQINQKSLIIILGDFFQAQELHLQVLANKHEIVCIVIRDRFEEKAIPLGLVNIIDPLTQKMSKVNLDKKAVYNLTKKLEKEDELLFEKWKKLGVRFVKIYTDELALHKLMAFMSE